MGKDKKEEPELISVVGSIFFRPIGSRDLKGGKKLSPYCKVYLDKEKKFKTKVVKSEDPVWAEQPRLIALTADHPVEKVVFAVWDEGMLTNDYVGVLDFKIKDLLDGVPRDDWYVLKNKKGNKERGELHCQIMYLEQGEDITPEFDEFTYPLHCLLEKEKFKTWDLVLAQEPGPDVDKVNREGYTALHITAINDLPEYMRKLMDKGANIEAPDSKGQTPLHKAAESSLDCLKLLLEKGAKHTATDNAGLSALHVAAATNKPEAINVLLEKGADINAQDENGNTPLHHALLKGSKEAIVDLVKKGADIYKSNKKGDSAWKLSIAIGVDDEATKAVFYEAVGVVDDREFPLKQTLKNRLQGKGKGLKSDWQENPQWAFSGPAGAKVHLLLHYDDPISKTTLQMEKSCFMIVDCNQAKHKEMTYIQDKPPVYGSLEPVVQELEENRNYVVIPYPKLANLTGEFFIILYSDSDVVFTELQAWEKTTKVQGEWVGKQAGGCIEHESWVENPKFLLTLPPKDNVEVCLMLEQERSGVDMQPYQVKTYKNYMGFYIYDTSLESLIGQCKKWKNVRESCAHFVFNGNERSQLVVVPTLYKPGEEARFVMYCYSDDPAVEFKAK